MAEPCATCRFDPAEWSPEHTTSTLRLLTRWIDYLAEGADDATALVLAPYADKIAGVPRDGDLADLHTGLHLLDAAGRVRHAGAAPATGRVVQVSRSGGGVPKTAVARAEIGRRGLAGDLHDDRLHHGRPWQALCLWSTEVIEALAAEGHPIGYGSAGENITITGLDWATMRPGLRLRLGTALVETTLYTVPCAKNARWFVDGDFGRILHEHHPGESRIYARVLEPGAVAAGDAVLVEPPGSG